MIEPFDVFLFRGPDDYSWIGCAHTIEDAKNQIRRLARSYPGVFVIHSQKTGNKAYYRAAETGEILAVEGPQ